MTIPALIQKIVEGGWKYHGRPNITITVIGENKVVSVPPRPPFNMRPRIIAEFDDGYVMNVNLEVILLDPLAWKALGKAMGWDGKYAGNWRYLGLQAGGGLLKGDKTIEEWQYHWYRMIDHLAEGGTLEEFVATL